MFHCGRMKNGGANIVLTNEGRWVDGRFEDRGLDTESHWCGVGGFLQMTSNLADSHKNLSNGGQLDLEFSSKPKNFTSISSLLRPNNK